MDDILIKIIDVVSRCLKVNKNTLNLDSGIKNTDNWDSLTHVLIVINICDAFSLKFDEGVIPELTSIRKIYNFIKENKKMIEKISSMAIVIAKKEKNLKALLLNNDGEWVFPKGHLEANETELDAAIRELYEESNVKVNAQESIGQVDEYKFYFSGENAVKVIKVFAFIINGEREITYNKNEGFLDGKWVEVDEALKMLKHNDAKNALEKTIKKIK